MRHQAADGLVVGPDRAPPLGHVAGATARVRRSGRWHPSRPERLTPAAVSGKNRPSPDSREGGGMRIRRLFLGILTAAALVAPAAPASAGPAAMRGSVASTVHRKHDAAALRAALQGVVDAGASGAIGLVDDGKHVSTVAVGAARLDPRRPIRLHDQVRVGSITKTVISTITLQLVGEGRLHLSDTVQQWLPGAVPNASAITLRMLLNHTSGIFDYVEDPAWHAAVGADPNHYWSPCDLIAVANTHPPVFPPGQGL